MTYYIQLLIYMPQTNHAIEKIFYNNIFVITKMALSKENLHVSADFNCKLDEKSLI